MLDRRSVVDNVALSSIARGTDPWTARERALELLDSFALADHALRPAYTLSGGQRQRVAIARAIAKRPDVLLCDEPTGALDINTGVKVLEALQSVNREFGTTTAVITHNAVISDMAHRVITLSDGNIESVRINKERRSANELIW